RLLPLNDRFAALTAFGPAGAGRAVRRLTGVNVPGGDWFHADSLRRSSEALRRRDSRLRVGSGGLGRLPCEVGRRGGPALAASIRFLPGLLPRFERGFQFPNGGQAVGKSFCDFHGRTTPLIAE